MKESFVCKIPLENISEGTITVFSQWDDCSFSLKIIHRGNAWEKNISSDSVNSMSTDTQLQPAEYIFETKRALTTNEGIKDFTYSLMEAEFTWKKLVENFRVKYGSVLLEKATISSVTDAIIDFMINQKISAEKRKNELEKENSHLRRVNSNLRSEVDNLVSSKNEMEETLYSKFQCLLNAKKEKIQKLEKELEKGKRLGSRLEIKTIEVDQCGSETEIESEEENPVEEKDVTRDEYGSETELDTDGEDMGPSSSKIKKLSSPVLVTQNYNLEDISDSSASGDKKYSELSSGKQNIDVRDGESSKLQRLEESTSKDSKTNLRSSQHNNGKFTIEDLLEDM